MPLTIEESVVTDSAWDTPRTSDKRLSSYQNIWNQSEGSNRRKYPARLNSGQGEESLSLIGLWPVSGSLRPLSGGLTPGLEYASFQ